MGTARKERQSGRVARYILKRAVDYGFDSELVDVMDYSTKRTIPPWENPENFQTWREIMIKADGLIMVVPEYNHSYPGEFKLVLDQLKDAYRRKPVSICGVSSGRFGGARMIESLIPVLVYLQLVPTSSTVNFSKVKELFDSKGNILDPQYDEFVDKMLKDTEWFAKTLRLGKEKFGT